MYQVYTSTRQGLFQGEPGGAFAPPLSNWLSLSLIWSCPPLDLDLPPPPLNFGTRHLLSLERNPEINTAQYYFLFLTMFSLQT